MLKKLLTKQLQINFLIFSLIIALFFAYVLNFPFLLKIYTNLTKTSEADLSFFSAVLITLPLLLYVILTLLTSYKYLQKPLSIILILLSAITSFSALSYNTIFDVDMLTNFIQTNVSEASSYFSIYALLYFIAFAILPCILIIRTKITYPQGIVKRLIYRIASIFVALIITAIFIFIFYQDFAYIGRQDRTLQKSITPIDYIYASSKYINQTYLQKPTPPVILASDAKIESKSSKPKLVFFILGETARAANYKFNGYSRNTNIYTELQNTINFKNVSSCGTATAQSVPCMFSDLSRSDFSLKKVENRDGLIDVLNKVGINNLWFENDSGCKGVCNKALTITTDPKDKEFCQNGTCFDQKLLKDSKDIIDKLQVADTFSVFHIIGSHGPKYYERYPKDFEKFTPTCQRADLQKCSTQEIINTYDNTILYTDFIVSEFINVLKNKTKDFNTILIYISDHGESLGENGLFLHGTPYAVAPNEQTKVPMQMYLDDASAIDLGIDKQCLIDKANNEKLSHNNIYHSIVGLFDIKTKDYDANLDIFKSCRL